VAVPSEQFPSYYMTIGQAVIFYGSFSENDKTFFENVF
jgi:hypothetical protein